MAIDQDECTSQMKVLASSERTEEHLIKALRFNTWVGLFPFSTMLFYEYFKCMSVSKYCPLLCNIYVPVASRHSIQDLGVQYASCHTNNPHLEELTT